MSFFSNISSLVADYALWKKYEPVIDEVEMVLKKHGIDVAAMISHSTASPPGLVDCFGDSGESDRCQGRRAPGRWDSWSGDSARHSNCA